MLKMTLISRKEEFDKLQRAHTELTQRHRIDAQRLLLPGDAPWDSLGKGMAPRPPVALMRRHEANRVEVSYSYHLEDHDQVQRELEKEVNEPQYDAGQPSSIAALPVTSTDNTDGNSNHVCATEVSLVPHPIHLFI